MLREMPKRHIEMWIDRLPTGEEFTVESVLDGIRDFRYAPTRVQISSYLRSSDRLARVGYIDTLIVWKKLK